ncbi:MAG: hypothetical protein HC900_08335 [Methylacidiphilales bacterium]|nr:hypothetical protein [Candidatus Methylacidiphilales bacterium]
MARLLHTGGHAQGLRHLRKLRTYAGRLMRDIARKTEGTAAAHHPLLDLVLDRVGRLLRQKPADKDKLLPCRPSAARCAGATASSR